MRGAAILTTPTVPRYEPTEKTAALQTPRAQGVGPDAFGGGLARGLGQASGDYLSVLKQEKDRADATATLERRVGLDTKETELTWGTDDSPGFLRREGKEVFGLPEKVLSDYDLYIGKQEAQIPNEEQRKAFRLFAQQRRNSLNTNLQRHISTESEKYAKQANEAALKSTLNNVALYYNDPQRIEQELRFGLGVIESNTENASIPREAVDQRRELLTSMMHKTVIGRLAEDSPLRAKAYFEANKDRLTGDDAAKIEATLKPLAEAQQGMDAAGEIFYGAGEDVPLADMLKTVRERHPDNPNVVKAASAEIKGLYAAREEANKQAIDAAESAVYASIAKVKLAGGVPRRGDVPQADWNRLAQVAPEKVEQILSSMTTGQGSQPSTDQITTWGLLKTDPKTLTKINLDSLLVKGKLNQGQYKDLITDQLAIRQGKGEKEITILTNKAAVDTVLKAVGITQNKNPERYAKFYEAMNRRMKAFETENGKAPKQEEITNMARGLLFEVSQDVNWWPIDKSVPAFEADTEKIRVPAKDQAAITQKLKTRGIPVTEATIREVYLEAQKRGGS